jgi:hypothetical protein
MASLTRAMMFQTTPIPQETNLIPMSQNDHIIIPRREPGVQEFLVIRHINNLDAMTIIRTHSKKLTIERVIHTPTM